jgi:hypothetical protein
MDGASPRIFAGHDPPEGGAASVSCPYEETATECQMGGAMPSMLAGRSPPDNGAASMLRPYDRQLLVTHFVVLLSHRLHGSIQQRKKVKRRLWTFSAGLEPNIEASRAEARFLSQCFSWG